MAVTVASWNVKGNLGSEKYSPDVWRGIEDLRESETDIIVMPEAWWAHEYGDVDRASIGILAQRLGYLARINSYPSDIPGYEGHQHYLLSLWLQRANINPQETEHTDGRVSKFLATDPTTMVAGEVYGLHLTSLNEDARTLQVTKVLDQFRVDPVTKTRPPMAIMGDFNTMHPNSLRAKLISNRLSRQAASLVPHPRARSLATRLTQMGEGKAIGLLERAGFREADPSHQATMKPWVKLGRLALVQLDHIMVNESVKVEDFSRHEFSGSDHLAISAQLGFMAVSLAETPAESSQPVAPLLPQWQYMAGINL